MGTLSLQKAGINPGNPIARNLGVDDYKLPKARGMIKREPQQFGDPSTEAGRLLIAAQAAAPSTQTTASTNQIIN